MYLMGKEISIVLKDLDPILILFPVSLFLYYPILACQHLIVFLLFAIEYTGQSKQRIWALAFRYFMNPEFLFFFPKQTKFRRRYPK